MSRRSVAFMVRIEDEERRVVTIVCEACGLELPIGGLNWIDADAAGEVMIQHVRAMHQ